MKPQCLLRIFLVPLVACTCAVLPGQHPSAIRWWGKFKGTTEAREGRFTRIAAGADVTAVLRDDGRIFANGENTWATCEVPEAPAGTRYIDVSVRHFGLGLLSDGNVVVWGSSPWLPPNAPSLPAGVRYTQVSAGSTHALAMRSDRIAIGWSNPFYDSYAQASVPPALQGSIRRLAAGGSFSLALMLDGTIAAWGDNTHGQCNVPALPVGAKYLSLAAGNHHAVAVRSDGMVVAWGMNAHGQVNVPPLPSGAVYVLATAGRDHCAAYRSDGAFVAWGAPDHGLADVPVLPPGVTCVQLVAGFNHCAALLDDGSVVAWGDSGWRQAGVPGRSALARDIRWTGVAEGLYHSLGLLNDGTIVGWGWDDDGQATPTAMLAGMRFVKIGAGGFHSLALREDGQIVAWGSNAGGRTNVPLLPPGVVYTDFAVGMSHTVALRSDGHAVAFGYQPSGYGLIPPLPGGLSYVKAAAAHARTLLLRSDGVLVFSGPSGSGQQATPQAPTGREFVDVATALDHSAALLSDGTVAWWGTFVASHPQWRPIPSLPFGVCYVGIAGSQEHMTLRRSDGQLEVCGLVLEHEEAVPPLAPDTSYVEIDGGAGATVAARIGPTCTYVSFAPGCAGSRPSSRLIPRDTPHLGRTLQVTLFDLPQDIAVLAFGWQRLPAPMDLGVAGMPGCSLHVSLDALVPIVGQNGQAKWHLPIPSHPIWVGTRFYNQALVLDPAAGNAFGAVVGDATEAVIGHW
ncbi:MAG: hypothetical protein KF830_14260 [Planctomycetes bacterium]|nr:hypothetical protein [Planctomycetota bacterium]